MFSLAITANYAPTLHDKPNDSCDALTSQLKAFKPLKNFAFSAGDKTGRKFTYEGGNVTMQTPLVMASASKFPAATAVAAVVAAGNLTFDTHVHEVFDWWTSDPDNPRSAVTLRHLLSFTSGFYWKDASGVVPCLEGLGAVTYTPEECAQQIYEQAPFEFTAGSTFSYNSFHLQVAGAMAAKAAGTTVQGMLSKYLIDKLGMKNTKWLVGQNPYLAAGMETTGDDYDKFLQAYLKYEHLPKAVTDEMERDYLSAPYATNVANSSWGLVRSLGHYSMCNYYECLQTSVFSHWTEKCAEANIHMDAVRTPRTPRTPRTRAASRAASTASAAPARRPGRAPPPVPMVGSRLCVSVAGAVRLLPAHRPRQRRVHADRAGGDRAPRRQGAANHQLHRAARSREANTRPLPPRRRGRRRAVLPRADGGAAACRRGARAQGHPGNVSRCRHGGGRAPVLSARAACCGCLRGPRGAGTRATYNCSAAPGWQEDVDTFRTLGIGMGLGDVGLGASRHPGSLENGFRARFWWRELSDFDRF